MAGAVDLVAARLVAHREQLCHGRTRPPEHAGSPVAELDGSGRATR